MLRYLAMTGSARGNGKARSARIDFAPNSLFRPDKAELIPCYRELIPCSVAQGILPQISAITVVFETAFAENG